MSRLKCSLSILTLMFHMLIVQSFKISIDTNITFIHIILMPKLNSIIFRHLQAFQLFELKCNPYVLSPYDLPQ